MGFLEPLATFLHLYLVIDTARTLDKPSRILQEVQRVANHVSRTTANHATTRTHIGDSAIGVFAKHHSRNDSITANLKGIPLVYSQVAFHYISRYEMASHYRVRESTSNGLRFIEKYARAKFDITLHVHCRLTDIPNFSELIRTYSIYFFVMSMQSSLGMRKNAGNKTYRI